MLREHARRHAHYTGEVLQQWHALRKTRGAMSADAGRKRPHDSMKRAGLFGAGAGRAAFTDEQHGETPDAS